jgi:hypothetical protein
MPGASTYTLTCLSDVVRIGYLAVREGELLQCGVPAAALAAGGGPAQAPLPPHRLGGMMSTGGSLEHHGHCGQTF